MFPETKEKETDEKVRMRYALDDCHLEAGIKTPALDG